MIVSFLWEKFCKKRSATQMYINYLEIRQQFIFVSPGLVTVVGKLNMVNKYMNKWMNEGAYIIDILTGKKQDIVENITDHTWKEPS